MHVRWLCLQDLPAHPGCSQGTDRVLQPSAQKGPCVKAPVLHLRRLELTLPTIGLIVAWGRVRLMQSQLNLMNKTWNGLNFSAIALQVLVGAIGGGLAWLVGFPMPFLVGGLVATSIVSIRSQGHGLFGQKFPQPLRRFFTATIGVMIGQSFTPNLLDGISAYWLTLTGVACFVLVAQTTGFALFRFVGGYDRRTAFFAAMPGGLIEAITFAEQFGADVQAITVQHFARVILVVVTVPFLFLLWTGVTVGSASGVSLDGGTSALPDLVWTIAIAAVGIVLGRILQLPAGILIGPMVLSAALQASGVIHAEGPTWLLYLAQLVVGVGLGTTFSGISRSLLVRAFAMCALSVVMFLSIGACFAYGLHVLTGFDLPSLLISFAPGGVTEMSLIALSLNLSPLIVALHHVFRIITTVVVATIVARRMQRTG